MVTPTNSKKCWTAKFAANSPYSKTVDGEIHHAPRYEHHAKLVAIGVLPEPNPEAEAIFKALGLRNSINMHSPSYTAGIVYEGDSAEAVGKKIAQLLIEVGTQ